MLRRIIAAAIALSLAVPVPALASFLAGGGCTMDSPMLASERCDCCTQPMAAGPSHCAASAAATTGCGCTLRADNGSAQRTVVATASPTVTFHVDAALIAAELSTPRRIPRDLALAASPPGAGATVSRPTLCTWII